MNQHAKSGQPLVSLHSSWLAVFFQRTIRWAVSLKAGELVVQHAAANEVFPIHACSLEIRGGVWWATVKITSPSRRVVVRGAPISRAFQFLHDFEKHKASAIRLRTEERKRIEDWVLVSQLRIDGSRVRLKQQRTNLQLQLERWLEHLIQGVQPVENHLDSLSIRDRYFSAVSRERFVKKLRSYTNDITLARYWCTLPYVLGMSRAASLKATVERFDVFLQSVEQVFKQVNEDFVEQELIAWRSFFNECEKTPLSDEQARSIITCEENTLLIAAAGSGKTSTVVGKVLYLLAKGLAKSEDILCLTFNSAAAREVGERISARLLHLISPTCPISNLVKANLRSALEAGSVTSRTFHALALDVVRRAEKKPRLQACEPKLHSARVQQAIEVCCNNPSFSVRWALLQTALRFPQPKETRFRNMSQYDDYLKSIWKQKSQKKGIQSLGCRVPVRSFEELAISNWLYTMGVPFEYEQPFEAGAQVLGPGASWHPDFTYTRPDCNLKNHIIHEHFGLNDKGKAPKYFENPDQYENEAAIKKRILAQLDSRHFWTTSAEYSRGELFANLEVQLRQAGISLQPRSHNEIEARLREVGCSPDNDLIVRAVSQIRQNGWSRADVEARHPNNTEPYRVQIFLDVVFAVVERVNEMVEDGRKIDYDEMIRRALIYLQRQPDILPYRFVIADEFQDVSPGRGELLKLVLSADEDTEFFAVGDDWQAINRFAGSDLSIFYRFAERYNKRPGADCTLSLTQTFRSNQGIVNVSRTFVLKNKSQRAKDVFASNKTEKCVVDIRSYKDKSQLHAVIEEKLGEWSGAKPSDQLPSVLMLSRYGKKNTEDLSENEIDDLTGKWQGCFRFIGKESQGSIFCTMHSSKGLEADYVMVLGLFRADYKWNCFPSEREDDPLLSLVLPQGEQMEDAEERRLMYVALTRSKHQVALFMHQDRPSPYALEILNEHRDDTVLFNGKRYLPPVCRACKGNICVVRKNGESGELFYACLDRIGCRATGKKCTTEAVFNTPEFAKVDV